MEKRTKKQKEKPQNFFVYEYEKLKSLFKRNKTKGDDKKTGKKEIGTLKMAFEVLKEARKADRKAFRNVMFNQVGAALTKASAPYLGSALFGAFGDIIKGQAWASWRAGGWYVAGLFRDSMYERFDFLKQKSFRKLNDIYTNKIVSRYYVDILHKPRAFFKVDSAERLAGFAQSVAEGKKSILNNVLSWGEYAIVFGAAVAGMATVSPMLGAGVLAATGVTVLYGKYMNDKYRKFGSNIRFFKSRINEENRDIVKNAPLVQSAGRVESASKHLESRRAHALRVNRHLENTQQNESRLLSTAINWAIGIAAFAVSVQRIKETGNIGEFALVNGCCWQMFYASKKLSESFTQMQNAKYQVIDDTERLKTPRALERETGQKDFSVEDCKIEVKDLSFAYPKVKRNKEDGEQEKSEAVERGQGVLHHIDLSFDKGEMTTIIGDSGKGKSTLVSLFRHDYDPVCGKIYIGGKEIRELSDEAINRQVSFVDQKVALFDMSIRDNLRFYKPGISDDELLEVCEKSAFAGDLLDMVAQKDEAGHVIEEELSAEERKARILQALERRIGKDGSELSGGQRQRLALARAFIEEKPIVILDEPTTGLNQGLSFKVMKSLKDMAKDKTVVLVTHNPVEVALSDRVVVMRGGKVEADGKPLDLIRTNDYMRNETLTASDYANKQELYRRTIYGVKPEKRIAELAGEEAKGGVLLDSELKEKRRLLELHRDVYVKVRKKAIESERKKQGKPLFEKKTQKEKSKDGFSPKTDEGRS